MAIDVARVPLEEVLPLRELYRREMACHIVHDSLAGRDFGDLFLIRLDGRVAGYGFVTGYRGEPRDMVREFYVLPALRGSALPMFCCLVRRAGPGGSRPSPTTSSSRSSSTTDETDIDALPVEEIGPAIGYGTRCLGFTLVSRDRTSAVLRRDDVRIGLPVNGRDPEQASCWFSVDDVDALWQEYEARGTGPGIINEQKYDGRPCRVSFAKEPHGVCSCFTQPL